MAKLIAVVAMGQASAPAHVFRTLSPAAPAFTDADRHREAKLGLTVQDKEITPRTGPRPRTESPTKLAFPTGHIAAVRVSAPEYGGAARLQECGWEGDGARVCDRNDPEGNVFQLREVRVGEALAARQ